MRRKIIRQGKSTLTLSLPATWVKTQQLKTGDEVDITIRDQTLLINAKPTTLSRTVHVDLRGLLTLHQRLVASAYLTGADEIKVTYDNPAVSRRIQERVRDMIGMEIIAQDKESLTIKDVTGGTAESFDSLLRRVFYLLLEVARETLYALKRKEKDLAYLRGMESNINRFTDHCQRILIKHGSTPIRETPLVYGIILGLEQLADEYKRLTSLAQEYTPSPSVLSVLERQVHLLAEFEKMYYTYTPQKAATIAKTKDQISSEIDKKLDTKSLADIQLLHSIRELTELTIRLVGQTLNLQGIHQA